MFTQPTSAECFPLFISKEMAVNRTQITSPILILIVSRQIKGLECQKRDHELLLAAVVCFDDNWGVGRR